MAVFDNVATAAAALRRLASEDEAVLMAALSYMGREPFRRLRRAVGRTNTPLPSDDEGGSGPAGAQTSGFAYRLDPAENVTNQVTASPEANINNLDPALVADPFLAAVPSPTASMTTQCGRLHWAAPRPSTTTWPTPPRLVATLCRLGRLRLDPPL